MASRLIPSTPIKFGEKYDPTQARALASHVDRITQEMQRIQQLLSGGAANQVLTKTNSRDYVGAWAEASGGFADAPYIISMEDERLTGARVLVEGDNISFDLSEPGELRISASGSGSGVTGLSSGVGIEINSSNPAIPIVGIDADSQASLALADSAVQPEDLADVAFSGEYDDLDVAPPYYLLQQAEADKFWLASEFKRGHNIIGVRYPGAAVRLPHDLEIEKVISVKNEHPTIPITISAY